MREKTTTTYDQLVELTSQMLGPASERFIERQVVNHLNKPPTQLTPRDIPRLADWLRLALSILTDDPQTVHNYMKQLRKLSDKH